MVSDYRELNVWNVALELGKLCYQPTRDFPREELFGLTTQIRRAVASIPANIAEGHGRGTTKEYMHFLRIANGSLKELESHLFLAEKLEFLTQQGLSPLIDLTGRIGKMLTRLRQSLSKKLKATPRPRSP